jgi:hypothetical protein
MPCRFPRSPLPGLSFSVPRTAPCGPTEPAEKSRTEEQKAAFAEGAGVFQALGDEGVRNEKDRKRSSNCAAFCDMLFDLQKPEFDQLDPQHRNVALPSAGSSPPANKSIRTRLRSRNGIDSSMTH